MKKTKTKICKSCGAENPAQAKYCQVCGEEIPQKPISKTLKIITITFVALIILFVFVVVWQDFRDRAEAKREAVTKMQELAEELDKALNGTETEANSSDDEEEIQYNYVAETPTLLTEEERTEKEQLLQNKLATYKKIHDDFHNLDYYYPQAIPTTTDGYSRDKRTFVLPFIIGKDNIYALRGVVNYFAQDWLFITSFELNVDGDVVFDSADNIVVPDFQRDHNTNGIYESYNSTMGVLDNTVTNKDLYQMFRLIAISQQATIRFYGQQYYDDFVVPDKDRQAIKDVLNTWDLIVELYGQ